MKIGNYKRVSLTIDKGEKTATDGLGRTWAIKGLLIPAEGSQDTLHPLGSDMCNAIAFRGMANQALVQDEEKGWALLT